MIQLKYNEGLLISELLRTTYVTIVGSSPKCYFYRLTLTCIGHHIQSVQDL